MNKVLNFLRRLHPTKELSKESALWTVVAIILMGFALWVVFTANWQTEGFYKAGYKGGKLVEAIEVLKACRFSIVPHVTSPPAISHRNTRCVDRAGKYFLEYAA